MGIETKSVGMLVDELCTISQKCFKAQDNLMNTNLTDSARLMFAIQAQQLNKKRNELIRAIDTILGQTEISPTEKTY
jgi:hypothetical protein